MEAPSVSRPHQFGARNGALRIALLASGIGLALYTQFTLRQELTIQAGVQFAIAILMAVIASFGVQATTNGHDANVSRVSTRRGTTALWLISCLSIGCSIYFFAVNTNRVGWLFHFAAMGSFLLAVVIPDVASTDRTITARFRSRDFWVIAVCLLAVMALALAARLPNLREFPYGVWFDEATTGLIAKQMLREPGFRPVYLGDTQLPAHFNYLVALSFCWFGADLWSIRIVPTVFVVAATGLTFLLMNRWFNPGLAFMAALLLVFSRWSLTLSRFGLNGHLSLLFVIGTLYFFDRAWCGRKLRDFAIGGMFFGMGLNFYYAFRLFAVAACVFVAIQGLRWLANHARTGVVRTAITQAIRNSGVAWLAALFGALVTITPIAQFAVANPEAFFARTSTVSIFTKRDEPDLIKALVASTTKHALMFNVRGDGNGRHNIPGEPMLDEVTATLALLGVGIALSQIHRPRNLLILLTFAALMMAGILSVDFEAPQGYRTNLVTLAISFFGILPIATLWQLTSRINESRLQSVFRGGLVVAATVMSLFVGQRNLAKFHITQRASNASWVAQSVGETFAGQEMNRLAATHKLFVSDMFANSPTQRFVAPNVTDFKTFTPHDFIELPSGQNRNVAYILDHSKEGTWKQLQRLFPNGAYRALVGPSGGNPIAFSAAIAEKDVGEVAGVTAMFWPAGKTRESARTLLLQRFSVGWGTDAPLAEPFIAEIAATLAVPQYGDYSVSVLGAKDATVFLDEIDVSGEPTKLAKGYHTLRVLIPATSTRNDLKLMWQGAVSQQPQAVPDSALYQPTITNEGLQGDYFRSDNWSGAPAISQIDPQISFFFHHLPLPRPYTVQWKGRIFAERPGRYTFGTLSVNESILSINGSTLIDNASKGGRKNNTIELTQGWHDIVLRFADRTGYSQVYLYWQPPNGSDEIIPQAYLRPPSGRDPSLAEMSDRLKAARGSPAVNVEIFVGGTGSASFVDGSAAPNVNSAASATTEVSQPKITNVANRSALPRSPLAPEIAMNAVSVIANGADQRPFGGPKAVASKDAKTWYVADSKFNVISVFNERGEAAGELPQSTPPMTELSDIVLSSDGHLLILDADQSLVRRYNIERAAYSEPIHFDKFATFRARGLSVDASGNLFVADTGGGRVLRVSATGQLLTQYGQKGTAAGELSEPNHALLAPNNLVYVVDVQGKRIAAYELESGKYVGDFAIPPGNPAVGSKLALGPDNTLFVSIPELHEIHRYGLDGRLIQKWGRFGTGAGELRLPMGITVAGKQAWIADFGNQRVQTFSLP